MEFKKKEKKIMMGVRVKISTNKKLLALAAAEKITKSSVLEQIIENYFSKREG